MECSICLDIINEDEKYNLSCNHTFHYQCYLALIYNNNFNMFVKCPLCREINTDNKQIKDNPLDNLKLFCPTKRCCATNKNGKRCQHKAHIFNYGYCYHHNNDILQKEKYDVFLDYIRWLMETGNSLKTKLIMIDLAKKILIKNPEINSMQQIQHFFYKYYHLNKKKQVLESWSDIYYFYDLLPPLQDWVDGCMNQKIIF